MNSPIIARLLAGGGDRLPVILVALVIVLGLGLGVLAPA